MIWQNDYKAYSLNIYSVMKWINDEIMHMWICTIHQYNTIAKNYLYTVN